MRPARMERERGFIALMTAVLVSAIILMIVVGVSASSLYARFDGLGAFNRLQAEMLARSCLNVALHTFALSNDPNTYNPHNQKIQIDTNNFCVVKDASYDSPDATIDVYGSSANSFVTVSVKASITPILRIISWTETP